MGVALNNAQLEILNMFSNNQSEQDLEELRSLLIAYLAHKATREADKFFDENGYTTDVFEKWKNEHFRISSYS